MRRCTLLAAIVPLAFLPALGQQTVTVKATSKTVSWGYYGSMHPAATVHSGDTVVMQTLSTCGPADRLIARGVKREDIPAYNDEVYQNYPAAEKGPGGHILTGPVEIAEAEPGDVLEVQILKVDIDANFACNGFGLHRGFLPMEFPYSRNRIIPLDREKMIGHFAPGIDIPLHPFFGSMGVAGAGGKVGSTEPFAHAGNMDNKELVAGTTLYIPVVAKGAMFEAGDGHAGQGNGEVDITAMETFLTGTFKFVVHKKKQMNWPRAETPTHYITMGFSPDLKEATEHALRDMIDFLVEEKHMKRDDAYMLSSVAVDLDITELVDGNVGVHAMCPKNIFTDSGTK
ncbi:MAG: acetamidase/formamidase family protein [Acidobacteria bacterium]|nr:acetamidase/formamidase family protein [Acidobacteriota bacterium]